MNVHFTDKQQAYIKSQIEQGDYQNASELVREALRMHQIYRVKVIEDLRTAVHQGMSSGTSSRSVSDIIADGVKRHAKS
ncbi:MAG: type II toxin-antitoxin system ParD family antitoxin [Bacteroidetes bacterium]|nr:MAG: type II toxin-antitoxin system ParD family antitoxin [Bacteroidota bacterium]